MSKHASCLTEDRLATKLAHTSMSATTVNVHTQDFNALNPNHSKMHNRTNKCQIKNKIPTPVNAKLLEEKLQGYDIDLSNRLVQGFKFEFSLNFQGTPRNKTCTNHKSATENPDTVYLKLAKESLSGRARRACRKNKTVYRESTSTSRYFVYLGKGKLKGVELTLRYFKNNKTNKPVTIFLSALPSVPRICPNRGPLFQHTNGQYVSAHFVTEEMKKLITFIGLNPTQYKGHSFRIGAATNAASLGHSEH
ncbi:unnamed protein product [Mytilus coruscus]|uniref:Tyr recombinase domain-containing protein n=1 Tax=Mytilus coruscus TaxID=42192 RepID=A0A6J8BUD8_MYTCO|nr:unnamed protein product [Mytilus coruscus]